MKKTLHILFFLIYSTLFSQAPQIIKYSGTQTINSKHYINSDIIIESNSVVTFTGNFYFENSSIQVEQDATIIVKDAMLDGYNWGGISAAVNIPAPCHCDKTGIIVKNSTIKNAEVGVSNVPSAFSRTDQVGCGVHVENSIFDNKYCNVAIVNEQPLCCFSTKIINSTFYSDGISLTYPFYRPDLSI
jgi:hypothetical protein